MSRGVNAVVSLISVTTPTTRVACCPLQMRLQKLRKRLSVQRDDGSTLGIMAATLRLDEDTRWRERESSWPP